MPERNFKIGIVQMSCTPEPEENLERAIAHVRDAAAKGAELICLPELFQTQYFCQREDIALFDLAEPIPGPATKRLGDLARELKVTIIASLFERRAAGLYHNTAAILDKGGKLAGIYRKMHIPDDPLYYEKFYFTPGDLGFKAFETDFGKFGTLVCWDQWYPEGARLTALQGANVLFYPTAIGWHPDEKANTARRSTMPGEPSSARTPSPTESMSPCPIASASRPATFAAMKPQGKGLEFWGGSFIADPFGQSSRRHRTTRKRFWSPKWICAAWKMCAATGRSGATAASMPTGRSHSGS